MRVIVRVKLPGHRSVKGSGNVTRSYEHIHCLNGDCIKVRKPSERDYEVITTEATRRIELLEDQYNYMISDESCPHNKFSRRLQRVEKYWKRMSKKKRLEFHIGELLGHNSFEYDIVR